MIYLSDDYVDKYIETLSYLIGRAIQEGYTLENIENIIANSNIASEMEKSNVTSIAFSSSEKIYSQMFKTIRNNDYEHDVYSVYGWLGYIYINLFLSLKITFELLFIILPLETALNMYHLYHEMSFSHLENDVKSKVEHSYLNMIMKKRIISNAELSKRSGVAISTISSLRYKNRDINKLELQKAVALAQALRVKSETLLKELPLIFDN